MADPLPSTPPSDVLDFETWYRAKYRNEVGRLFTRGELHEAFLVGTVARSESVQTITVSRSLAERTEAMFRSVDPEGHIAQEWKEAIK